VRTRLIGLLSVVLAIGGTLVPAGAAHATPSHHANHSSARAQQALDRAKTLFHTPARSVRTYGESTGGRDATMVLRDLAMRLGELAPADRRTAERILARPTANDGPDPFGVDYTTTPQSQCFVHVCVHWVSTTRDVATALQVQQTGDTFDHVWDTEVGAMGYRAPKSDLSSPDHGEDGRLDVYLADIGGDRDGDGHNDGVYGYCTTDDPARTTRYDVSAYCVVDNDFAEFPANPLQSLQVTVAHEFFHAVQFSYDWQEDLWFMEGTAAWMEDEVYDNINDNLQFLAISPLSRPGVPLDYFDQTKYPQYGDWVFWKFLSEYFGPGRSADPAIIRQVWQLADASPGHRDDYSTQALRAVTARHGVPFTRVFADFGAVNRFPAQWYTEGRFYPRAPLSKRFAVTRHHPTRAWTTKLFHLTTGYARFTPAPNLRGLHRLRVDFDLPPTSHGSAATLVVHLRNGHLLVKRVRLDRSGAGHRTVAFSRSKVSNVELSLTNASTRFNCWRHIGSLSCQGAPKDDNARFVVRARAVR
jgi:hypothetical protein